MIPFKLNSTLRAQIVLVSLAVLVVIALILTSMASPLIAGPGSGGGGGPDYPWNRDSEAIMLAGPLPGDGGGPD